MFRSITQIAAILLMATALPLSAIAQENSEAQEEVSAETPVEDSAAVDQSDEAENVETNTEEAPALPPRKQPSAEVKKLNNAVADITRDLDKDSRAHFYMLYNNHNLIATVERVQTDVSNAVKSCNTANPEMESDLQTRFDTWNEAVNEKIEGARANVENMVIAQDYAEEKDIRNVMTQADELRDETMKQVERIPVNTKEACEYLLNKMDETQDRLTSLLDQTLVTLPQAMENSRSVAPSQEGAAPEDSQEAPTESDADANAENDAEAGSEAPDDVSNEDAAIEE